MRKILFVSTSLILMLSLLLTTPVFAFESTKILLTHVQHQPNTQSDQSNQTEQKKENESQEQPSITPPPKSDPNPKPEPKKDEKPKKDVSLSVSYKLDEKALTVHGKVGQKIDDGVFTASFQGVTKRFEGPGSSFTALFPRSELKPGTHTLVVSFKGMIGNQLVKDSKKVRVTIPSPPHKISLSVSYKLNEKNLTVHGKVNRKIDDGVFTASFQGVTKRFEGPGSSFTALFPRSELKPGTHTLVVSFKGMIGNQLVKDSKKVRVTIPSPPHKISLSVSYKLNRKALTVRGKVNRKVDDGVFTASFQGVTKRFEGSGTSFTALFPRSELKPGTHTLTVSFKGRIGHQIVKGSKKIRVTIPSSKISLSVSYKLNRKALTVRGKVNRKVDHGVFTASFQGVTKRFKGSSFTARFPRNNLEPGTHTLTVSFKGRIGHQIVKGSKKIRVTIPSSTKTKVSVKQTQKTVATGGPLPKTATNLPLLILSGLILMGIGITIWFRRKAF